MQKRWGAFFFFVIVFLFALPVRADDTCGGPPECCIDVAANATEALPTRARIGLRVMRIAKIAEQEGNFAGEITLMTSWKAGGLRPTLNARNASEAVYPIDETKLKNGMCYRERRINAKFQTWFRLRRFPFDSHDLRLHLEDRAHTPKEIVYEKELWPNTISIDVLRELPAWKFVESPEISSVIESSFAYPLDSPHPQLVVVKIPVERHSSFYISHFFVPLLVLVLIAYTVFWIRPDDLSSASAIAITCMLAIIAFQLAQADTLPRVPYLTIADRIYTVCYMLIAGTIGCAVLEAYLARHGREKTADLIDRIGRKWFPVLALALALGNGLWGWYGDSSEDAEVFVPPAAVPPRGETN